MPLAFLQILCYTVKNKGNKKDMRMLRRAIGWMLLAAICLALGTGCQKEDTSVTRQEKIALSLPGEVTGELNPFYTDAKGDLAILSLVVERFVSNPEVATIQEETTEEGLLKVTVTVSEDIRCSDKSGLYAVDFMYAVQLVCDPTYDGPYKALSESSLVGLADFKSGKSETIEGLQKVNSHTCTVLFSDSSEDYKTLLDLPAVRTYNYGEYVYGKCALSDITHKYTAVIATGPYAIDNRLTPDGKMVNLDRNEAYHGSKPKIEKCSVRYVRQEDVALNMSLGQLNCGFVYDKGLAATQAEKYGYKTVALQDGFLLVEDSVRLDNTLTIQQALLAMAMHMQ